MDFLYLFVARLTGPLPLPEILLPTIPLTVPCLGLALALPWPHLILTALCLAFLLPFLLLRSLALPFGNRSLLCLLVGWTLWLTWRVPDFQSQQKIQRAWLAGFWAGAAKRERIGTPDRTPSIELSNRFHVVVRCPEPRECPQVFASHRSFHRPVGSEARIFLEAGGEEYPPALALEKMMQSVVPLSVAYRPCMLEMPAEEDLDGSALTLCVVVVKRDNGMILAAFFAEDVLENAMVAGSNDVLGPSISVRRLPASRLPGFTGGASPQPPAEAEVDVVLINVLPELGDGFSQPDPSMPNWGAGSCPSPRSCHYVPTARQFGGSRRRTPCQEANVHQP